MSKIEQFSSGVLADLRAQQEIGILIPAGAFARARDLAALAEFESMSASGCADLLVQLANLGYEKRMNRTEITRYRELNAKAHLSDEEIIELDDLETKCEKQEQGDRDAMGRTYAVIQREETKDVLQECRGLELPGASDIARNT